MLCFPNCKINLGLYIVRRREDGYHDIETVFYPLPAVHSATAGVPLHDVLEIVAASPTLPSEAGYPAISLQTSGLAISGNSADNLVLKAYGLMKERYPDKINGLSAYLHKNIPMGAGLGGGSADGAFMLRLLNDHCKLDLSLFELAELALQLGSDCPFFIYNTPQFATGRGERFTPVSLDLSAYSLQVICPKVHVSTAKAFAMIKPGPAAYDLRQLPQLPVTQWKEQISNDFELPVFTNYPSLGGIKRQLYEQGSLYASMSGSGSAIYGLFEKGSKAVIKSDIGFKDFYIM
jgi:4-diphosphocytidyl-2-C-methyl-D-erythritol kinase